MDTRPTVLILQHHAVNCAAILDRAGAAYLVTEDDRDDPATGTVSVQGGARRRHVLRRLQLSRYAGIFRVSSLDSIEELSAVAAHLLAVGAGVDKVVTYTEETQYAGGYLAQLLGLDHNTPEISLYTRDKRVMKARAAGAGLPVPRYVSLPNAGRDADLDRIEAALGYPLVVKPANGWGSMHTTLVADREHLTAVLAAAATPTGLISDHLIAEQFIAGEELHADAVWRDGEAWVFFVSRYYTPRMELNTESGLNGSVLLREDDYPDLYKEVRELNDRYVEAIGLRRGTTHLELFRHRDTGRLVCSEIASRMAGANFPEVIGAACGVNERVLWAHELLDGRRADLPLWRGTRPGYVGWVNVPPSGTGTVRTVPDREELLAHPNVLVAQVLVAVGDEVPVTWSSTWGVLLVIAAETEKDLVALAATLTASIHITVE
jgi:hypothetical protein